MKNLVIVGGGFAGLKLAKKIRKINARRLGYFFAKQNKFYYIQPSTARSHWRICTTKPCSSTLEVGFEKNANQNGDSRSY